MAKIKFDPNYRIPENMDAIALYVFIPRKVINEVIPNFQFRDGIEFQTLINILERSEFEPLQGYL